MSRVLGCVSLLTLIACSSSVPTTDEVAVVPDKPQAHATPPKPPPNVARTWTAIHGQTIEMDVGEMLAVRVPATVSVPGKSTDTYLYHVRSQTLMVLALAPGSFEVEGASVRVKVRDRHKPETGARVIERFDGQPLFLSAPEILSASVSDPNALRARLLPGGAVFELLPMAAGVHHAVVWEGEHPRHYVLRVTAPGVYPPDVEVRTLTLGSAPHELDVRGVSAISTNREGVVEVRIARTNVGLVEPKAVGYVSVNLFRQRGPNQTLVYHVTQGEP